MIIPEPLLPLKPVLKEYDLAQESCVYFLTDEFNEVIYVGRTNNLGRRISRHLKEKRFCRVFYVHIRSDELSTVESDLINYYRPILNKALKRRHEGLRNDDQRITL